MDWEKIAKEAESVVQKRGGPESLKEDAEQLMRIAEGNGSMTEKLKAAAEAIKVPGDSEKPAPKA